MLVITSDCLSTMSFSMAYNSSMIRGAGQAVDPPSLVLPPGGSTLWTSAESPYKTPSKPGKKGSVRGPEADAEPAMSEAWLALQHSERGTDESKRAFKDLMTWMSSWTLKSQCRYLVDRVKEVWRDDQCQACFSDCHRASNTDGYS